MMQTHHDRHIGERPYKCPKCPKDFPQRGNLKAHMRTHENRERFVCRFRDCNKTFSAKGNLKVGRLLRSPYLSFATADI